MWGLPVAHFCTHYGVMPRPLKLRSELRIIRDALCEAEGVLITQDMFAARLQTSKSYINAIEAGTKQMTAKFADRLLQRFGVICSHPAMRPPAEFGDYDTPTPFSPRNRENLALGIRDYLARPKSDGRATFQHFTTRRLAALTDAAADRDLGPEVSTELNDAISNLIREFKLERTYKLALFARKDEWPEPPADANGTNPRLAEFIELLYSPTEHFPLAVSPNTRPRRKKKAPEPTKH